MTSAFLTTLATEPSTGLEQDDFRERELSTAGQLGSPVGLGVVRGSYDIRGRGA